MAVSNTKDTNKRMIGTTESDSDEMEIDLVELFFRVLEKAHWIGLSAVICAIFAAVYVLVFATPIYTASSKLYVLNASDSVINMSDLQIGSSLATDYVEVFTNWHVHDIVIQRLGLDYNYNEIEKMVSAKNASGSRILTITTTSSNPQEAKDLANTYANVAREFIAVKMGTDQPNVFEEARLPDKPSAPNKTRTVILGFLLGAFLAIAVVVILFIVDDRVRSAESIEKHLNMPVLGMMPEQRGSSTIGMETNKKTKKRKAGSKR